MFLHDMRAREVRVRFRHEPSGLQWAATVRMDRPEPGSSATLLPWCLPREVKATAPHNPRGDELHFDADGAHCGVMAEYRELDGERLPTPTVYVEAPRSVRFAFENVEPLPFGFQSDRGAALRARRAKDGPAPLVPDLAPAASLAEAREALRRGLDLPHGVVCPCCDRFAKRYRRRITSTMAFALILLHRRTEDDPGGVVHLPTFLHSHPQATPGMRGGDVSKLALWGLLEPHGERRDDGSPRHGCYRVTGKGRRFALGEESVPEFAVIYNDTLESQDGPPVTVRHALGAAFNYEELMAS